MKKLNIIAFILGLFAITACNKKMTEKENTSKIESNFKIENAYSLKQVGGLEGHYTINYEIEYTSTDSTKPIALLVNDCWLPLKINNHSDRKMIVAQFSHTRVEQIESSFKDEKTKCFGKVSKENKGKVLLKVLEGGKQILIPIKFKERPPLFFPSKPQQ